jgi:plastocyanin
MQGDGNLVIYTPSGSAVWSSSTAPSSNDRLVMQTDGNLVIYSGGTALWAKGKLLTGPPGPYNAGIITQANAVPSGTYGGQCLVWVANIVKAAGGPTIAFGYDPATYQAQWAKIANQVSWAQVRPGDIVQFVTSSNEHTLIITGGNSPSTATVVDSNFGLNGLVSRGSFASRAAAFNNSNYIIWRIHS